MEEIKSLLSRNDDNSLIHLVESDADSETLTASNLKKYISDVSFLETIGHDISESNLTVKKRNKERLPTRRPDPNVYNRNALLARENRRKKKIYLETIEKELKFARKANRVLLNALKHQMKVRSQLEKERMYLKELIAGRSQNLNFYRASKSPTILETETNNSISSSFDNLNFVNSADACIMKSSNIFGAETEAMSVDSKSDDLESEVGGVLTTSLICDDILNNNRIGVNNLIAEDSAQENSILRDVNSDHCYGANLGDFKTAEENYLNDIYFDTSELCSHTREKLFCSICRTYPECRTPPLQLLEDNLEK